MRNGSNFTAALAAEYGLTEEEFERAVVILGRTPNMTELGIFSVMWSEHCSYKSSRMHLLQTLPTNGPRVIQGPGENAGVVDIGDGDAVVFKMESHNHPSFIEPYQGAATGVGGILARRLHHGRAADREPQLAALRPPRPPAHPAAAGRRRRRHRRLRQLRRRADGRRRGAVRRPLRRQHPGQRVQRAASPAPTASSTARSGVGNRILYVGAKTGRDGIHGATMACDEFGE